MKTQLYIYINTYCGHIILTEKQDRLRDLCQLTRHLKREQKHKGETLFVEFRVEGWQQGEADLSAGKGRGDQGNSYGVSARRVLGSR